MNEKLRQLAKEAGFPVIDGEIFTTSREECPITTDLEEFVQLLVFECVNAVMDGTKQGDHYAQRIEQHFDNGPGGRLHFGVRE